MPPFGPLNLNGSLLAPKELRIIALPDVGAPLRIDFKIEPTFLVEDGRQPWVVAPVRLNDNGIVRSAY
jgi:hypothetical protein